MAEGADAGDTPLPLSLELLLDGMCLRFEAACQAGQCPRPEDFLAGAAGRERSALLRELIRLEVHYRRQRGEAPPAEEYRRRFPELPPDQLPDLLDAAPGGRPAAPAGSQGAGGDQQATGDYSPAGVLTVGPGQQGAGGGRNEASTPAPDWSALLT